MVFIESQNYEGEAKDKPVFVQIGMAVSVAFT